MGTAVFSMLYHHSHSACPTVTQLPRRVHFQHALFLFFPSKELPPHPSPLPGQPSATCHARTRGWTWGNQSGGGAPMGGWEEFQGTPRG